MRGCVSTISFLLPLVVMGDGKDGVVLTVERREDNNDDFACEQRDE